MAQFQGRKERIRERLDLEAFYQQELGALKKGTGGNWLGLCPFHKDKNPSFSVNLQSGLFNCFGCGAKGDVFDFYQQRHGCNFPEALTELGRRAGVEDEGKEYLNLTLKDFALTKKLPEDFLTEQGIGEYQYPPEIFDGARVVNFPYKDRQGKALSHRRRFANRDKNKFKWRKGDKTRLYGLWKLEKVQAAGWVLLVEGETDALTLWRHGLPALGIPGKETWKSSWRHLGKEEAKILQGLQVYLWQEPDAVRLPGQVAADLPGVKMIPAPPEFKDLSEAHCQGRDIKALVEEMKKKAQAPEPPAPVIEGGFSLSDLGNARRLAAQHGRDLRYSHLSKKWYWWTGKRWQVDNSGEVERRAKQVVGGIYREAAQSDFDRRAALGKFALKSEDAKRVLAMVRMAQSEPGIPVAPADLDAHPWLFNCENGTLDLQAGKLRAHGRADLLTCMAPVVYDPDAPCDLWEKFLYEIQDGKANPVGADHVMSFLQRVLGYSLTGSCREECLFILWGGGANGKTTLINVVSHILGDYSRNTPMETMLAKTKTGEIPTDVARLDGPRFVTASEVDRGRRLAESLVKALTGRDTVSARYLYGEFFDFQPQFKLFLSTNNKPIIKGTDDAIWRRIMFVPFPVQIPKAERDLELSAKLKEQGPGILAWMVEGCRWWLREGLDPPDAVLAATAEYRAEMDVLSDFLSDCCILNQAYSATAQELYQAYCNWCEEGGMKEKEQMKQRTFGMCLAERGFRKDKGAGGRRLWLGLGLRSQ